MALHLIAIWGPTGSLWGVHHYAFLPRAALVGALLGLAVSIVFALRLRPRLRVLLPRGDPGDVVRPTGVARWLQSAWIRALGMVFGGAFAFVVFWLLRERHRFLGDALVLVQDIPNPNGVHPLEPVAMALQRHIYSLTHTWFERPGRESGDVAHLTTALGSAVAGVLFVFTAWSIARELVIATRPARARRDAPEGADPAGGGALVLITTGILLAQGYVQLFFGYVENYTFLALAIGYYVSTALAFLNRRGGLLPVALACSVAVCLHLSAAALLPSLAMLVVIAITSPGLRTMARRDAVPVGVLVLVIGVLLASMGTGYDLPGNLLATVRRILTGDVQASLYLLSSDHARDIANVQLLIGPIGLACLVPILYGIRGRSANFGMRAFLLTLSATCALVALVAGDSNLGYARNWDLLAPLGIPFTTTVLFLLLEQSRDAMRLQRTLIVAGLISVFHTASWVTLNASLDRSLERFKTLPLGGGLTESTVGYWYASQERPDLAEPWLLLSLRENPNNARAHLWLGHVYMMTDRREAAVDQFSEAVRLRPGVPSFQLSLINAMVLANRPAEALVEARNLVSSDPASARLWAVLGTVLLSLKRGDEAHDAFQRATVLAPRERVYTELLRLADAPSGVQPILERFWTDLTL